jgi:hypothetical protein
MLVRLGGAKRRQCFEVHSNGLALDDANDRWMILLLLMTILAYVPLGSFGSIASKLCFRARHCTRPPRNPNLAELRVWVPVV